MSLVQPRKQPTINYVSNKRRNKMRKMNKLIRKRSTSILHSHCRLIIVSLLLYLKTIVIDTFSVQIISSLSVSTPSLNSHYGANVTQRSLLAVTWRHYLECKIAHKACFSMTTCVTAQNGSEDRSRLKIRVDAKCTTSFWNRYSLYIGLLIVLAMTNLSP